MGNLNFFGQKVLLCTCHQDDEVLFSGGLLNSLRGNAEVTVCCFLRPLQGRTDTDTRVKAMAAVCEDLGVNYQQLPFGYESWYPDARVSIRRARRFMNDRARREKILGRHPYYQAMRAGAIGAIQMHRPNIIITHNIKGEYGHPEHFLLHNAVCEAARKLKLKKILNFGQGLDEAGFVHNYDVEAKRKLFKYYLPQWDGVRRYKFALSPEKYVPVDVGLEPRNSEDEADEGNQ